MNFYQCGRLIIPLLFATQFAMAQKILSVAKSGSAAFTSIQTAIDQADPGDIIQVEDLSIYEEQITIDSTKSGIVLKSQNPASKNKPVIKWQDTKNQLPKNYEQLLYSDSINYYKNGALRVLGARNVSINGIKIDGGGAAPFEWEKVFESKEPLFHANSAIALWQSAGVIIKNCEISNAYFGVYVYGGVEGGIFASQNSADIGPYRIAPISRFGKTGNHIIEDNRIHDNSWGVFFDAAWDQGSIIRYNLFYENHHTSSVKDLIQSFSEDGNQPGGAILFKDVMLSPISIHNNTFWHNNLELTGHWRAGGQHLIFNNIFAKPAELFNDADPVVDDNMDIDPVLANRMHNCLWGVHKKDLEIRTQHYNHGVTDPETNNYIQMTTVIYGVQRVEVMTGMDKAEAEGQEVVLSATLSDGEVVTRTFNAKWAIQPGARLTTFARDAEVRWYEVKFISTDPESQDFLVPDWDNPDVKRLVLDQGWPEAGILDADGSVADIGAIPKEGRASCNTVIHATNPVIVNGTNANVTFDLIGIEKESLNNLKVKYIRWINNVEFKENSFGSSIPVIPASSIVTVTYSGDPLKMGTNNLKFSIPACGSNEHFAFLEMIIEGKNLEGKTELSSVGFIPFRKLDYLFDVQILDYSTGKVELEEIKEGEPVKLSITPKKTDGVLFDSTVNICNLSLQSGYLLRSLQGDTIKIQEISDNQVLDCYFSKVPPSGYDRVSIGGSYEENAFFGSSKSIRILPGDINKLILKKATPAPEIKIKLLGRKLHLTNQTNLGPGEQLKMELFDIMGCRVEKFIVRTGSPKQFNLDNLSSGLYFCVVNYKGSVMRMNLNLIR